MINFDEFDDYSKSRDEALSRENETRRVKFLENTSYYIENYLKPSRKWNKEISGKQRIDLVRYADVNWAAISDHIKGMDYQDFLATPYWKAIAAHTRYKAGYRCQLCNNGSNLVTHHRNYGIHGREHVQMNELIVLCNNCHQKFHAIERIANSRSGNATDIAFISVLGVIILYLLLLIL